MEVEGKHHPVLPLAEVARQKDVFWETVARAVEAGHLNGYKVAKTWLVMNDALLDRWQPPAAHRPKVKRPRSCQVKEQERSDAGWDG